MTEELREDVRAAVRRHNPGADELRDPASDLERLADRYELQGEIL